MPAPGAYVVQEYTNLQNTVVWQLWSDGSIVTNPAVPANYSAPISIGSNSSAAVGSPGQIDGITGAGNYPPGPPYGICSLNIAPQLYATNPGASIMGIAVGMATDFTGVPRNVFGLSTEVCTPSAFTGAPAATMYGIYGEVDHNGSGNIPVNQIGYGVFGACYNNGTGTYAKITGGYFETCGAFYSPHSIGTITQAYGVWCRTGGLAGTINNCTGILIDTPYTGATFSNPPIGLHINDQGAASYQLKIEGSDGYCDFGQNAITFNQTNAGISFKAAKVLSIGDGNIGANNGTLEMSILVLTDGVPSHAIDSGISRLVGGSLAVGNGTQGDASGKLTMAHLKVTGLQVFANNAAAITGGLAAGDLYRTGADPDVVCVVH